MSNEPSERPFKFDDWIAGEFEDSGPFTALVVLVSIGGLEVVPLRSTFLHVIGNEIDWLGFSEMMRGAKVNWDGAMILPMRDEDDSLLEDDQARAALRILENRIGEDRLVLNEGNFFDKWGRRLKIEEAQPQ